MRADLQKAVGSGDGAWFATADGRGRGQLRGTDGSAVDTEVHDRFVPTVYLYDNYPGGVGQSEPLWRRQGELVVRAQRTGRTLRLQGRVSGVRRARC